MKNKKPKKSLAIIVSITLVILLCPLGLFDVVANTSVEDYYTYSVDSGEATITEVDPSISGDVTIPSFLGGYPVTTIGDRAFFNCSEITSITIPEGIKKIDDYAFFPCSGINTVNFNATNYIATGAYSRSPFEACSNLKTVNIGASVTDIPNNIFFGCGQITTVNLSNGVKTIGPKAFSCCYSLKSINIPDGVTRIGEEAFFNCDITSVVLPDSVTAIDAGAFYMCDNIASIKISKELKSVGKNAFMGCQNIESVYITDIASLCEIDFGEGDSNPIQFADNLYLNDQLVTDLVIPEGVTEIKSELFLEYEKLTSVTIPGSVKTIGEAAFLKCSSLTDVVISEGVKSIGERAFLRCTNLENVNIPEGVTSIGSSAFYQCSKITSIVIPSSLVNIGEEVFSECTELTDVTISEGVTSIGRNMFSSCKKIENIVIPSSVSEIKYGAFSGCYGLEGVYITDMSKWCDIQFENLLSNPLYYANKLYLNDQLVTDLVIPHGVESINQYSFVGGSGLNSVFIPNTLVEIGREAFNYCVSLTDIYYSGSKTESYGILFTPGSDCLFNANWHYNSCIKGADHIYTNTCDEDCNECGFVRQVPGHSYDNCYDSDCNACGFVRQVTGHKYDNDCDAECNECSDGEREITHEYNGDHICDLCGYRRINIALTFPDAVNDVWYSDAVGYVVDAGIMKGYESGYFGISDGIQRQDFLVMLARLDGVDLSQYEYAADNFSDVKEDGYYKAAVNWGYENGIVTGYQDGRFGVGDMITREQIVTFLYRYANYKVLDTGYSEETKQFVQESYVDFVNVSEFATNSVLWALEKGVIKGKTPSEIVPQGNAQRCEVAQIMYNIFLNDIF